jgi:hypothetical protein
MGLVGLAQSRALAIMVAMSSSGTRPTSCRSSPVLCTGVKHRQVRSLNQLAAFESLHFHLLSHAVHEVKRWTS